MAFGRAPLKPVDSDGNEEKRAGFFPTNTLRINVGESRTIRLMNDPTEPSLPEPGVAVYTMWHDVKVGDKLAKRKVFMDKATKFTLPEHMQKNTFYRVFMNVYDLSPVILVQADPNDPDVVELAQRDSDGKFTTGYKGKNRDTLKYHEGKPVQNKRVMILEATHGMVQQMEGLPLTVARGDDLEVGGSVALLDMTITLAMRYDPAKKQNLPVAGGTALTSDDRSWWKLPRYNMDAFNPWPQDAVHDVLSGADFEEVMKKYNINRIPKLQRENEEAF